MLIGCDISHHNQNMKDLNDLNDFDFVIMKATEGIKFKDPALKKYIDHLKPETLRGFYHFCRADLFNDPGTEAFHFINTIRPYLTGREVLALDVEEGSLNYPGIDNWCCIWMQTVHLSTGVLPLLYISVDESRRFKGVCELGCGLWAAKWSDNKPTKKRMNPWDFWAFWQYTNKAKFSGVRIDMDYFNGSREQFLKYAKVDD